MNEFLHKILEFSEAEKTPAWASSIITIIRRDANPLISEIEYNKLKRVLFGKINTQDLDKIFVGKEMVQAKNKLSKSTIFFFEKVRNALIDDRTSARLSVTINSLDPEKEQKKKKDKELLMNRKGIEAILKDFTDNNGMPPITVGQEGDYHGNVEEFDAAGYSEFDTSDIDAFFENSWGLQQEKYLQAPINAISRIDRMQMDYDRYITDILICLSVVSRVYVDEVEGAIRREYIKPYELRIFGDTGSNDCKDAQAFFIEKETNIRGLIRRFGDSFSFEEYGQDLLMAVNYSSGSDSGFTGIRDEQGNLVYGTFENCIGIDQMLDSKIKYGYIEFKAFNGEVYEKGKSIHGNYLRESIGDSYSQRDGFVKESKYQEDTYRAYYLITGDTSQKLIQFGRLYMQPTEGVNDEFSGFSIKVYRRGGVSASEIIKPYWEIMQRSFQKFEMLINDIKPDGFLYVYESLVKVAEYLQNSTDAPTDIRASLDNVLKMYNESPNKITTIPTDDEDQPIGGGQFAAQKLKNGLNESAVELMKIMDWCETKVESYLSTQGIDIAEPRDGFKLSIENKKRTRAATAYIDVILLGHIEDVFTTILSYVQDISKFKDQPSYKYLETLVGAEVLDFISKMDKSPHRYGTFIDTFNNDIDLMEIRMIAQRDHDLGNLTLEQYMMIRSMDNIKQALFYLSYERKKTLQQKQQDAMSVFQQQEAAAAKEFDRKMKLEDKKGEWMRLARKEEALGFSNAAAFNARASITREMMKQSGPCVRRLLFLLPQ